MLSATNSILSSSDHNIELFWYDIVSSEGAFYL